MSEAGLSTRLAFLAVLANYPRLEGGGWDGWGCEAGGDLDKATEEYRARAFVVVRAPDKNPHP